MSATTAMPATIKAEIALTPRDAKFAKPLGIYLAHPSAGIIQPMSEPVIQLNGIP